MAWAEKLPSGRWRGLYRDADDRRRSAGTHPHKAAAVRAAAAAEEKARNQPTWRDPTAGARAWGEWAAEWWPSRAIADSTRRRDLDRMRTHLEPRWADVPVASITRQDVKAWAADLRRQGVGPSTVQRIVHLLSASLNAAVDAEVIAVNPAARIRLPKGALDQERYLTRAEYAAIRDELPTTVDQLLADVLVHTGIRWGELAGLHAWRAELDRGVLSVVETYNEETGRIEPHPKGKKARIVPLTPELVEAFGRRPVAETCGCEHAAGRCRSGLLITTVSGRPVRNSNWSVVWREAVDRSGVGHARIHDLRHTYASWLLQAGVPLAQVGRLLGHVSPQTTAKYAHLAETPNAAVLAALAAPSEGPSAPREPHEVGSERA